MGLFAPTVRPGAAETSGEIPRLEARANLPKSQSANFLRIVGIIIVVVGAFAVLAGGAFGIIPAIAGVVSGGFIWAAGALQQTVYDIRTLMLRDVDRRDAQRMEALLASGGTDD